MNLKKIQKIILFVVLFVIIATLNVQAATVQEYLFDEKDYLANNPDVAADAYYAKHAYEHFINCGIYEGRIPSSKYFNATYYLTNNPDIAADRYYATHAYEHFIKCGVKEGRAGTANFDARHYLANNGDVAADKYYGANYENAFEHYLANGAKENRKVTDHIYDEGTVTTEATCTEPGVKTIKCTVENCQETKTEEIPATDHTYNEGTVTTEATCTVPGERTYTCSECGDTKTEEIPVAEHAYVKVAIGAQGEAATCTTEGTYYKKCSNCGYEEKTVNADNEEVVKFYTGKLEHNYNKLTKTVAATCTNGGYKLYTCSLCGVATQSAEVSKPLEHKIEKVEAKEATCTENGNIEYYTCSNERDNNKYADAEAKTIIEEGQEVVKSNGHTYTSAVTTEATCTTIGERTYTCSICDATKTEAIPATNHANLEKVEANAPTCSADGNIEYYVCGNNAEEHFRKATDTEIADNTIAKVTIDGTAYVAITAAQIIDPKTGAHDYDTTVTPATATSCEKTTQICKDCGHKVVSDAHTKGNLSAEATCTTPAKYICSKCGKTYDDGEALGHTGWTVVTPKTCTTDAVIKCTRRGCEYNTTAGTVASELLTAGAITEEVYNNNYKATGHTPEAVPATTLSCVTDGVKANTFKCHDCEQYFTTANVSSTTPGVIKIGATYYLPVEKDTVVTEKLGHNYEVTKVEEATCTATGTITSTCTREGCGSVTTEVIPVKGHTFDEVIAAKVPTCDVKGNVAYAICNACKGYFTVTEATEETPNVVKIGSKYYTIAESTEEAVEIETTAHTFTDATIISTDAGKTTANISLYCNAHKGGVLFTNIALQAIQDAIDVAKTIGYKATVSEADYYFDVELNPTTKAALGITD